MQQTTAHKNKTFAERLQQVRLRITRREPWTMALSDLDTEHLALAGAKAVTLGRMLRAGLQIPPGFVVTTPAFRAFMRSSPRAESTVAAFTGLHGEAVAAARIWSRRITDALGLATCPDMVASRVQQALDEWPEVRLWAVRSSASTEDLPGASFAGQHESFLNVPRDQVLARVRDCWVSLFSPRALAYRMRNSLPHQQAGMAVIIQQMVPADTAGVLFTADPASGKRDRIVLEGWVGLGDKVVSGRITPNRVVLSRPALELLERSGGGGPDGSAAPAARAGRMALDEATARRLADTSLQAEEVLGGPLDIEWATSGGEIHLLQARPITSRCSERNWEDRQIWANPNLVENLPDVVTPASWSVLQQLLNELGRSTLLLIGVDLSRCRLLGLVAGRAYFNLNAALAANQPFALVARPLPSTARALGGELARNGCAIRIPAEDLPDLGFRWPKYILSWPRILRGLIRHSPRRGDAWTDRLKDQPDPPFPADLETLSKEELLKCLDRFLREGFERWDLLYLLTQAAVLPLFHYACRHWLADPDLAKGYRLFAGMGGLPEAEAGLDLWRLALRAHADPEIAAAVRSGIQWSQVEETLSQNERGPEFLAAWGEFMSEHGHHCRGELELFNARWSETPDYILGLVRGYLGSIGRTDPLANRERLAQDRERLTAEYRQRLTNPIKRWLFTRALSRAQRLAVNREVWKSQAVRRLVFLRHILLALGQRLHHTGVLLHPDDIFFLEVSEIEPVATGQAGNDAQGLISARRQEYEANQRLTPPPLVVGRFKPTPPAPPSADGHLAVLTGIPVSPGVVTGRAKVILHTDNHEQALPGEILVAPFTDPAWTPYLVAAAGLVSDQGGILSHGSILAREYGLPAVTNVESATQNIRTGDLLRVDGDRGRVEVLERAQRDEARSFLSAASQ